MNFSKDFLWGCATSSFQYEGASQEDGKGLSICDIRAMKSSHKQADTSVAADGYHHLEEDIQLLKELGVKSYRFSISWSRIIPDGDDSINPKGIEYYNKVIDGLVQNNIEPVITLLHFDIPYALQEKYGGFANPKCIDAYLNYAKVCFENFGDRVHYWLTINEQNVMVYIPEFCGFENTDSNVEYKLAMANYNMYVANAKTIQLCHELCPNSKIGPCVSYPTFYPATCNPKDVLHAYMEQEKMAFVPMEIYANGIIPKKQLKEWKDIGFEPTNTDILQIKPDFLGVNWYCTMTVKAETKGQLNAGAHQDLVINPHTKYSEYGWNDDPDGLRIAMNACYNRFHLPIMICENGWSEKEVLEDGKVHDKDRIQYISDQIKGMDEAIGDGVELIGYQMWSFVDLLSSSQGFSKRYGLVFIDREDFDVKECKRYKKDSYYWYQNFIKENTK